MIDIEQKSDGLIGVYTGLKSLQQIMTPAQFEMFCENVPDGEALWDMMRERSRVPDTPETFGWPEFAREILEANSGKYMTPRSCILPDAFLKEHLGKLALQKMAAAGEQMTDTEMLAAHREEQPALDKMRRFLCGGCNKSSCPWYMKGDKQTQGRTREGRQHGGGASKKSYHDMTDAEIKQAASQIVHSSLSDEEIQQRLRDELGYPYGAAICSHIPTDQVGREARAIVYGLGGVLREDGAMVMMMMHGPTGNIISL